MKEDNRQYDLKVRCVGDYNRYIGVPTVNSSVSVVHYDEIGQIRHSRTLWGVYGLFLLDDTDESLGYGSGGYDYHCGSLVCVAPSQIGGASDDGTTFRRKGWALLFHPSFFHGTDFEKTLLKYEFFHYHVNEALPMNGNDREKFVCLLSMLKEEISGSNAEAVVRKLIELILSYCQLFFNRHFNLPASKSSHIVSRFEEILNDYYTNSEQLTLGQPTVRECAERLCIAPNYLGDLIRQETGESAIRFIGKYIVNRAKSMLMEGHSIAETAYTLGFGYPAHLTRLFNRIEVYAWLWTMNLEHDRDKVLQEHPEWFSVNRNGKSLADTTAYVGYYKFLCPALPEVREFINDKIKSYCEVEGLNGIAIDYHRFVDVVLPTTLWPRYGIVQDREYAAWDYGYHPEMLKKFKEQYGYDPREQEDPSLDVKWRQFRCDQITEVANMIAETVHSYGKTMAASPFPTPKMSSRMVRQDWGKWNLDIVFPMVYDNFYTGAPSFISDCTIENARDKNSMTTLYCGMMASDGPRMFENMDAALNNGAQGIALFTINGLRSPETRTRFKEYTDSIKAVRAANGGIMKATYPKAADPDPFHHEGVMKQIEERMQDLISEISGEEKAPLSLGEYKLIDSYDATRCYQVTDACSNTTFNVTFYLYGDVLSGWDAAVAYAKK